MWEKGSTPVLAAADRLLRKRCAIDLEVVNITSPDGHTIECRLFYNGTREELANEKRLILDIPGGGFISMSPVHHADYLSQWCRTLNVPILAVDYRKAPSFPFPCGFEDSWYVYKAIVDTNGKIAGINCGPESTSSPILLALVGDSAGGNLTAAVTVRAIVENVRVPDGIHLIYPILDFGGEIWRSTSLPPPNTRIIARESRPRKGPITNAQTHRPDDAGRTAKQIAHLVDPSATPSTTAGTLAPPPPPLPPSRCPLPLMIMVYPC